MVKIIPSKREDIKKLSKDLWDEFGKESEHELDVQDLAFVIEENNKNIGIFTIKIVSGVAILEEMVIKSEYRNKKTGYNVMEYFEKLAKEHNCHKLRIKTCPEVMPVAFHLYKKLRYIEEAVLKNDYFNKDWVILKK